MGKSSRRVRTRSRTVAKLVPVLCERPFPDDWNCLTPVGMLTLWAWTFSKCWAAQSSRRQFCLSFESLISLSLSLSLYLSLSLSVSLSLSLCKCVLFLGLLETYKWHWRDNLICRCGGFEKKTNSVDCELGSPLSCKVWALVGHVWSSPSVSLVTRQCCCRCCNYNLQTDLGSSEFSCDDSYMIIHRGNWSWQGFRSSSVSPRTTTSHSNHWHCNFDERAKLFPREKGVLPRQKLKRACDAMDTTGAHDVARDDTQISHFLGLLSRGLRRTACMPARAPMERCMP